MVHEEKTGCFKFGDRKWSEYVLDTSSTGLWSMVTDREMRETRMYGNFLNNICGHTIT